MATHETELHSCPECQKIFSRQASLRAHLMLHCVDDNILCVNCGVSVETQVREFLNINLICKSLK